MAYNRIEKNNTTISRVTKTISGIGKSTWSVNSDIWNDVSYTWDSIPVGFINLDTPKILTSHITNAITTTYSKVSTSQPTYIRK